MTPDWVLPDTQMQVIRRRKSLRLQMKSTFQKNKKPLGEAPQKKGILHPLESKQSPKNHKPHSKRYS